MHHLDFVFAFFKNASTTGWQHGKVAPSNLHAFFGKFCQCAFELSKNIHLQIMNFTRLYLFTFSPTFVPAADIKRQINSVLPVTSHAQPDWSIFTLVCWRAVKRKQNTATKQSTLLTGSAVWCLSSVILLLDVDCSSPKNQKLSIVYILLIGSSATKIFQSVSSWLWKSTLNPRSMRRICAKEQLCKCCPFLGELLQLKEPLGWSPIDIKGNQRKLMNSFSSGYHV